jgi:pimeloyl-ACP methyl ester carboxylesterase
VNSPEQVAGSGHEPQVRSFDLRVPVPSSGGGQPAWEIAASVYLPAEAALAGRPPVLVVMPGGGYGRRYFDLPVPGYSQAEHHARQGTVVIALDYLGAGDSSAPPMEVTTLSAVAAANHAAISEVLGRLRQGTLADGVPPVDLASITGAGQSLGGHALAATQAGYRTFDGVALLGSSMAGTALPVRPGASETPVPDGATPEQAAMLALASTDWTWAFHWEAAPAPAAPSALHDGASLIAADIASGLPARQTAVEWGSLTVPGFSMVAMLPGALAGEAAVIDVPVLLATGERDVCRAPAEEVAAFKAATDVSVFVVRQMAHMHNFAATRARLWERLDEFVAHVTRVTAASQPLGR